MYALNRESAVEGYISRISRQKSQAFLPEGTKYANLAIIWHPQPSLKLAPSHCRSLAPIAIAEEKQQTKKAPRGLFVIVLVDATGKNA